MTVVINWVAVRKNPLARILPMRIVPLDFRQNIFSTLSTARRLLCLNDLINYTSREQRSGCYDWFLPGAYSLTNGGHRSSLLAKVAKLGITFSNS